MALDTFETLLSLGTGFASGASKRKRENELLELDIKQKEQTARINRISSIEKSLLTLFNTGQFSAESMMAAIESVPQLVDDERSSFGLLERSETELPEQPKPLTEFQRQSLDLRKQTFEATQADRELKARVKAEQDAIDAQTVVDKAEFAKQKEIGDSLEREIRDIDTRISENSKLLKDQDTPVEDLREANRRNVDLRRQRTSLTLQRRRLRDSLKSPITENNIRSKVDVFKKMIKTGLRMSSASLMSGIFGGALIASPVETGLEVIFWPSGTNLVGVCLVTCSKAFLILPFVFSISFKLTKVSSIENPISALGSFASKFLSLISPWAPPLITFPEGSLIAGIWVISSNALVGTFFCVPGIIFFASGMISLVGFSFFATLPTTLKAVGRAASTAAKIAKSLTFGNSP